MADDFDNLIDPQREAYRDGELSPAEAAAFEQRLAEDAELRRDYEAESQMLAMLAADDADADARADAGMALSPEAFTEAVLARWDAQRVGGGRSAAWRSPWRLSMTVLAAAAAITLAVYVGLDLLTGDADGDAPPPQSIPQIADGAGPAPWEPTSAAEGGEAMATLVKETQAAFVDRPRVLWRQLEERMSALSINALPALLPSPIPDPATLLEEPADAHAGEQAYMHSALPGRPA